MRQCRHMMYIVEDGIKADQLNKRKGDGHQIKAGRKWLEFKAMQGIDAAVDLCCGLKGWAKAFHHHHHHVSVAIGRVG